MLLLSLILNVEVKWIKGQPICINSEKEDSFDFSFLYMKDVFVMFFAFKRQGSCEWSIPQLIVKGIERQKIFPVNSEETYIAPRHIENDIGIFNLAPTMPLYQFILCFLLLGHL